MSDFVLHSEITGGVDRVRDAILLLGHGYLIAEENESLRRVLADASLAPMAFYEQLIAVVYRAWVGLLMDAPAAWLAAVPHATEAKPDKSAPHVALAPLGAYLWSPTLSSPALSDCLLPDGCWDEVVASLHHLASSESSASSEANAIGFFLPGHVYAPLLSLHPVLSLDGPVCFSLSTRAGSARKRSGSYYTPPSLVALMLDSALEPLLNDALSQPDPEAALLALKICDPSCGSGHFLVAATKRIAGVLVEAQVDSTIGLPALQQRALLDVLGSCIYGVDINPMAVALCQLQLWSLLGASTSAVPTLASHIQCGNGLFGATPALMAGGISNVAFRPLLGDEPSIALQLKRQNARERKAPSGAKVASQALVYSGFLADVWCSSFVFPLTEVTQEHVITESGWRALQEDPESVSEETRSQVTALAKRYQFFHWHLRFPEIFDGEGGGFDAILGNPPWEKIQPEEQHFFALRNPPISLAKGRQRKKLIEALAHDAPAQWQAWLEYKREIEGLVAYVKQSGKYPYSGCGRLNTYSLFLEAAWSLCKPGAGMVGLIVQTGLVTDDSNKELWQALVRSGVMQRLFDFENKEGLFPAVHREQRFSLVTLSLREHVEEMTFGFWLTEVEHASDAAKLFQLSAEDLCLMSPNTGACPALRSRKEAVLLRSMYRRTGVFHADDEGALGAGVEAAWPFQPCQFINMTTHSGDFLKLGPGEDGYVRGFLPVYEGKYTYAYDHRHATFSHRADGEALRAVTVAEQVDPHYRIQPQYWMEPDVFQGHVEKIDWKHDWFLTFHGIANPNNERTSLFSIVPKVPVGNSSPVFVGGGDARAALCLLAVGNSLVFDFAVRRRIVSRNFNFFVLKQLPVPSLAAFSMASPWGEGTLGDWIAVRAFELVYTSWDLMGFSRDCGYEGAPLAWDEQWRWRLRCELDAALFLMYGVGREDVEVILGEFGLLRKRELREFGEYRTKREVLAEFDRLGS